MSPEEALTIRTMKKQGVPVEDLVAEFGYPVEEVVAVLKGELLPDAGGPFDVLGPLNPDRYEGATREFAKRVLILLRDRIDPDRFFQICSKNGLDVNDVLHF